MSIVKSLMDKEKEEEQQLMEALRGRQVHDELVTVCLTELESLREIHAKENEELKEAMEELQSDLEEALLKSYQPGCGTSWRKLFTNMRRAGLGLVQSGIY
ncbi:unnamed protein product [Pleuronectes platessa]|uniref:Uncharacterized protein n=1 Tax=Pleuronectes platessa TaxID=8262 RepID=A0A9N7YA98_PLEPL|nr:unnamed protein product [Pleuronectes platessa]